MRSERAEILRFGVFEVDVRAGELRKQGARIKLQEQPFHVLTVLLQRPGEVVTREELRNQNWPADTFVDFDNSLNTAINKLREALGDSADNPRFIETLPRRGYRFIAPVSGVDGTARGSASRVSAAAADTQSKNCRDSGRCSALSWNCRRTCLAYAASSASHGKGHHRSRRLRQFHGGRRFRWNVARRALGAIAAVTVSESRIRGGNPADVANDGTAGECQAHAANRARSLSKDQQHDSTRRFDCFDWHPIRFNR